MSDGFISAGSLLSNIAFNLAQKPGHVLTTHDCEMLNKCRKAWDAACRNALAPPAAPAVPTARWREAAERVINVLAYATNPREELEMKDVHILAALAPEQAAPAQAPAADFDSVWRTLPVPGEYDSMDAFDQQRWRGIARAAFDVGRSVRAVPEGMIDANCHIAFMEAPPATSLDDFQLGWEAARKNVVVLSERWRWNLHKFLDVAAGEGYVLDGVDAATLYESVFPDEYSAALRSTMPTLDE